MEEFYRFVIRLCKPLDNSFKNKAFFQLAKNRWAQCVKKIPDNKSSISVQSQNHGYE